MGFVHLAGNRAHIQSPLTVFGAEKQAGEFSMSLGGPEEKANGSDSPPSGFVLFPVRGKRFVRLIGDWGAVIASGLGSPRFIGR